MGTGASLGGPGTRLVVEPTGGAIECITFGDSFNNPPHGVLGGTPGSGGGQYVEGTDGKRRYFTVSGRVLIEPGEKWVGISSGGGGYGNPHERDPGRVLDDAVQGIISRETALSTFGVSLTGEGRNLKVDEEATAAERARLGSESRPRIEPTEPGTSKWASEHMRPGDEMLVNPT